MSKIELAPAVVVRAAAWPLEALQPFGDRILADQARTQHPDYLTTYAQTLERERQSLWQQTIDDPRFLNALQLSTPLVVNRIQTLCSDPHQPRTKRIRRLEQTLYRYLARAVGRTTPQGLWAGVTLAEWGSSSQIDSRPSRYEFTPDLRPFQAILRHLGRQPRYRHQAIWRINPTLMRQPDGSWTVWIRGAQGQVEDRRFDSHTVLDPVLSQLSQLDRGSVKELAIAAIQSDPQLAIHAQTLPGFLLQLADQGLLLGGLDLPSRFTDVWDALQQAGSFLSSRYPNDQATWSACIQPLRELCDRLSSQLDDLTLAEFQSSLTQAQQLVQDLSTTLQTDPIEIPDPVLHCDFGLPLRIQFSPAQHQQIEQAIEAYQSVWMQQLSPATCFRQQRLIQHQHHLQEPQPLGSVPMLECPPPYWEDLSQGSDPILTQRLQDWATILQTKGSEVTVTAGEQHSERLPASPFGCLYALPFGSGWQVLGISDDATRSHARLATLLETDRILLPWLRTQIDHLSQTHHLSLAVWQGSFEPNPNVLAHPELGLIPLDLWGADPDTSSWVGATLKLDPITRLPFLHLPSHPLPLAVLDLASAAISLRDPIAEQILRSSFQENPAAHFRAISLVTPQEAAQPHWSPRVKLPDGSVLRPRRSVLNTAQLEPLLEAKPPERYRLWQQLAAHYDWPEWLTIHFPDQPPLLIRRDSPLALEACLKGEREASRPVIIEEAIDHPWLTDPGGDHYLAEVAIPFSRSEHGWSARRRSISPGGLFDAKAPQ